MRVHVGRNRCKSGQEHMLRSAIRSILRIVLVLTVACMTCPSTGASTDHDPTALSSISQLDHELALALSNAGFTGRIESTLEHRLGAVLTTSWPISGVCSGLIRLPD